MVCLFLQGFFWIRIQLFRPDVAKLCHPIGIQEKTDQLRETIFSATSSFILW